MQFLHSRIKQKTSIFTILSFLFVPFLQLEARKRKGIAKGAFNHVRQISIWLKNAEAQSQHRKRTKLLNAENYEQILQCVISAESVIRLIC